MVDTNCKMCGADKVDIVLDVSNEKDTYLDYLGIPYQDTTRQYVKCQQCGLVYRKTILDSKEKELLYAKFRDFGLRHESKEEYFERITSLPFEESENYVKCKYLEKYIPETGSILDVGCGAGVFLYSFKKFFGAWDGFGVEPTKDFSDIAKEHGIKIINEYLTESTFSRIFDLVSLNHVLEHLDDCESMLRLVKKYISSEGYLYIEVPSDQDIGFLNADHDRFMCQHDVIYSLDLLKQIIEKCGFKIIDASNFISIRNRNNLRVLAQKV